MVWKRLGRVVTMIVGISVILFVAVAAIAGTLTYPAKAIGVLFDMICLFGIVASLKGRRV